MPGRVPSQQCDDTPYDRWGKLGYAAGYLRPAENGGNEPSTLRSGSQLLWMSFWIAHHRAPSRSWRMVELVPFSCAGTLVSRSAGQPISPFRATTGPSSERRVVFSTSGGRSPPDRGAALPFTWSKRPSSLSRPSLQPHYAGTDIKRCIRWSSRIHN